MKINYMNFSISSAPAKIILFGEHFVVYDNPAILGAIDLRLTSKIGFTSETKIDIDVKNIPDSFRLNHLNESINQSTDKRKHHDFFSPMIYIIKKIFSENKIIDSGIKIAIESNIPTGVGLGSSAATSVALTSSIYSILEMNDKTKILNDSIEMERMVHTNSSGADCISSINGGMIVFSKNEKLIKLPVIKDESSSLFIINTGIKHSTGEQVEKVKKFRNKDKQEFKKKLAKSQMICEEAIDAIRSQSGDRVGDLMNQNQVLLREIGVSNEMIDKLINFCNKEGSFGSKITGAGGGGCIITLIPSRKIQIILDKIKEMKFSIFKIKIDEKGLVNMISNT